MQASLLNFEKVKNFTEIFDKGRKFKTFSSQIILHLEKTKDQSGRLSLGVLALKKIVGKKAVCRNKAKRRFKHGLLKSLQSIALNKGFHIKIIALTNKNTITCPWSQILADIEKQLQFINSEIQKKGLSVE